MENERECAAVWLWHEKVVGASGLSAILRCREGEEEAVWGEICRRGNLGLSREEAAKRGEEVWAAYLDRGVKLLLETDDAYPGQLKSIAHRMPILSVIGDAGLLQRRQVAIVGSRKTSEYGETFGAVIAQILMSRGFTITSGGALGIDAIAHREAMKQNLPTIVVTATNAEQTYPRQNGDIFEYARSYGAVVSQFPQTTEPLRELFPSRNSIIAGLSSATCIVQCREGSGALYTAEAARKLGRPVYVAAMSGFSAFTEGGLSLVKRGMARLVSCAGDFDELGRGDGETRGIVKGLGLKPFSGEDVVFDEGDEMSVKRRAKRNLEGVGRGRHKVDTLKDEGCCVGSEVLLPTEPFERQIYELLGHEPVGRDVLAREVECGDLSKLTETLIEMEFSGLIKCVAGRYRRA